MRSPQTRTVTAQTLLTDMSHVQYSPDYNGSRSLKDARRGLVLRPLPLTPATHANPAPAFRFTAERVGQRPNTNPTDRPLTSTIKKWLNDWKLANLKLPSKSGVSHLRRKPMFSSVLTVSAITWTNSTHLGGYVFVKKCPKKPGGRKAESLSVSIHYSKGLWMNELWG